LVASGLNSRPVFIARHLINVLF